MSFTSVGSVSATRIGAHSPMAHSYVATTHKNIANDASQSGLAKRPVVESPRHSPPPPPAKRFANSSSRPAVVDGANNTGQHKTANRLPVCLKKLVRSIVRTFYSREHSLIVDMLVRNTIMSEDDLCERLRFEKKQLRQYLHTLKTDQFIKSKIQLETDADGKTTKIIHYFIEYQLFVNVVKYRLDQMQRRLEADQRQSTSRASFRCASCRITYTDLEVDRLLSMDHPGKLECTYCRAEVTEEEDNISRTDARALIAKFHRQIRDPIDAMLRECDEIHLSSSILEPEIRPLEPVKEDSSSDPVEQRKSGMPSDTWELKRNTTVLEPPESRVRIVLSGQSSDASTQAVKQRPVWMSDSTINSGPSAGLGELDRGPGVGHSPLSQVDFPPNAIDSITQTLTPGRVPTGLPNTSSVPSNKDTTSDVAGSAPAPTSSASGGDIMQLLLVHERRGQFVHPATKVQSSARTQASKQPAVPTPSELGGRSQDASNREEPDKEEEKFLVQIGDQLIPYANITPSMIKAMTPNEKAEYIRIGKQMYQSVMLD
ncbi:unnamed protein product [Dicrocoelium dendriticum]|nr:unnamed protein product [Dicrocoelium dendriticum]